MATSIWNRKLDLLYLIFFITHIPVLLGKLSWDQRRAGGPSRTNVSGAVDLADFYPVVIRPAFTITLRDYYISTYRDRFFIAPPLWFKGFLLLELFYHMPLSIWAIGALLRGQYLGRSMILQLTNKDDPMLPLQLLIFAVEVAMTTVTCTLEMLSWQGYTSEERSRLSGLYLPYLGFCASDPAAAWESLID